MDGVADLYGLSRSRRAALEEIAIGFVAEDERSGRRVERGRGRAAGEILPVLLSVEKVLLCLLCLCPRLHRVCAGVDLRAQAQVGDAQAEKDDREETEAEDYDKGVDGVRHDEIEGEIGADAREDEGKRRGRHRAERDGRRCRQREDDDGERDPLGRLEEEKGEHRRAPERADDTGLQRLAAQEPQRPLVGEFLAASAPPFDDVDDEKHAGGNRPDQVELVGQPAGEHVEGRHIAHRRGDKAEPGLAKIEMGEDLWTGRAVGGDGRQEGSLCRTQAMAHPCHHVQPPYGSSTIDPRAMLGGKVRNCQRYQAVLPWRQLAASTSNCSAWSPSSILTRLSSGTLPDRMRSASGSCTYRWIARFSGRAP